MSPDLQPPDGLTLAFAVIGTGLMLLAQRFAAAMERRHAAKNRKRRRVSGNINFMNKNQLQQGDVTLRRVLEIPKGAKKIKPGVRGHVLAEGEVTGHAHRIKAAPGIQLFSIDKLLFLKNSKPAVVEHEEHKAFSIEPGIWEIGQVREYDYFQEMERTVVD